jgi:hypothetical protein
LQRGAALNFFQLAALVNQHVGQAATHRQVLNLFNDGLAAMLPLGNWKPWETVGPQGLTITEIVRDKEFVE